MLRTLRFLLAFTVLSFCPSIAAARNYYGAIAYSPDTGSAGYSYNYHSRFDAEAIALRHCGRDGTGCRIVTWFRNGCGALAKGPKGYGADWALDPKTAERKAMNFLPHARRGMPGRTLGLTFVTVLNTRPVQAAAPSKWSSASPV
jgi:Domain of unknown function (DUF4189)